MGMCRAVGTHPLPGHETSEGVGTQPWTWDLRGCLLTPDMGPQGRWVFNPTDMGPVRGLGTLLPST